MASAVFGGAAVVQQRVTHQVPQRAPLDPRLLSDLARRWPWMAAIGLTIAGLALQIAALRLGPLGLVQPILVCDVLFAVLISSVARHRPPDRIIVAGAACCAGGLAGFLVIAQPRGGTLAVTPLRMLPLAAGLAAVLLLCLAVARRGARQARPLAIALACGVVYGATAFLLKEIAGSAGTWFSEPLRHWPLYALVVLGPLGFQLNQSAFQAGVLIAPVLSVITIADPLVSIGIARLWLGESFASGPADIAGEVIALGFMILGVVTLAQRAPQVTAARNRQAAHRPR